MSLQRPSTPEAASCLWEDAATPREAQRALARALERQRLGQAETEAVEVQLLGQVTSAVEWPKLLSHWQRRNPSGVAAWPRHLDVGSYALNLWPLPVGRGIARASGIGDDVRKRQPAKLLCTPGLTVFEAHSSDARTALAIACATWLEDVGASDFHALRLAPPLLEIWGTAGRLISREIVDFDSDWSLPAAEGA
jgi:hypothetical protein